MKKYLVTGVSGFVAFHFLQYLDSLQEKNIDVLGIDINIPQSLANHKFNNLKLRTIQINMLDYPALETAMVSFSPEYVVHLAAFSSVAKSWVEPVQSFMNNTNIFLNVVEIMRTNNIKCRLLSVGSSEEYGNVDESMIPLKETMQLSPVSPYAIARVSQEMLSRCYVASYGLDIVLTRSFNHIGPGQRDIFVVSSFVKQMLEETKKDRADVTLSAGDVSIVRDFLDVRDVVRAYQLLLEKGVSGELYNICSGKGHTLKEVIELIAGLLNIKVVIEQNTGKIRPNDNRVIIGDNTKITEHTGWRPQIILAESLKSIINYWEEELNV